MATGKRYYWIKLKESFLNSDAVDFLMSQPDGANYVVLYQILCLKTINTGGKLARQIGEIIIPYDEEKIQRDAKWFTIDTVRVALNLYKALGLIYTDENGVLALAEYSNLVGSETDWAAQKRKQLTEKHSPELPQSSVETGVENLHTDIDIRDRDKILDKDNTTLTVSNETVRCSRNDVKRVIESWNQSGFKPVTKITSDSSRGGMLRKRITDYGVETVLQAIERAKGSDYLHGNNANGWEMDFGWFVRPNNFPKVLEGKYDNRTHYNKIVELKPQSRQACANDIVEYPKGSGQYRPYWEVPGYDGK